MRNVKTILAVFCAVFTMALVAGCKGPGAIPDGNYTLVSVTTNGSTVSAADYGTNSYSTLTVSGNNITLGGVTNSKSVWEQAGASFAVDGNDVDVTLTSGGTTCVYKYRKA